MFLSLCFFLKFFFQAVFKKLLDNFCEKMKIPKNSCTNEAMHSRHIDGT